MLGALKDILIDLGSILAFALTMVVLWLYTPVWMIAEWVNEKKVKK